MWELDGRQLRQILEICRSGSFAAAARTLSVSQPTLSKSVSRIEDRLRLQLFERSASGAVPTVYGEYLARRAIAVLAQTSSIADDLHRLAAGEAGLVRIGAGAGTMAMVIPALVDAILCRYPKLSLSVTRGVGSDLVNALTQRDLDMVISNVPVFETHASYIEQKLQPLAVHYVARVGHPIHKRNQPASFADILEYRLASLGLPALDDTEVLHQVPRDRWPNYRAFIAPDVSVLRRICLNADVVAAGPAAIFTEDIEADLVSPIPINFTSEVSCSILMNREGEHSSVLRALRALASHAWESSQQPFVAAVAAKGHRRR